MMNCRVWLLFSIIMFPVKQSTSVFHLTAQISFSTSRCYFKLYFAVPSKNHLTSNLSFFSDSELSSRVSRTRALAMSSADSWPQDRCQVIYTYIRFISISTTKNVVVWSCCAICWCQMKHLFEQAFSPSGWCIHSIGDWCSPNPWRQKDSSNSVSKRKDSKINHVINPEIMTPTLHASAPRAVSIAARSLACTCLQVFFDTPPMIRFPRGVMWKTNHQKGPRPKKRQYIPKRPKVYFFQIYPRDFRNFYQTHTCLQVPQLLTASAQPRFGASQQLVTNKRQLNLRLESAE